MSDNTPTTEQVRNIYGWTLTFQEFDRWLAGVKAQAWEEGVLAAGLDPDYTMQILDNSPYKEEA